MAARFAVLRGGNDINIANIEENSVPVTAAPSGYWALLNLIMMIATVLAGIYMLIRRFRKKEDESSDEEDTQKTEQKRLLSMAAAAILAIGSAIAFFVTEDMTNTMGFTDKYTILMAVLLILSALVVLTGKKKTEEQREQEA